uniref:Type I cytokine receptor cytokine-binding domain-containing protein n=1 Tax=Eptatretus burgeri TaxID=7764 RepID=A0A8C4NFW8_EPTBU
MMQTVSLLGFFALVVFSLLSLDMILLSSCLSPSLPSNSSQMNEGLPPPTQLRIEKTNSAFRLLLHWINPVLPNNLTTCTGCVYSKLEIKKVKKRSEYKLVNTTYTSRNIAVKPHESLQLRMCTFQRGIPCLRWSKPVSWTPTFAERTAVTNLSCVCLNLEEMTCHWQPGPKAPRNTTYRLYYWVKQDKMVGRGCTRYITQGKTHQACIFPCNDRTKYLLLINGSSSTMKIKPKSLIFEIEEYVKPAAPVGFNMSINNTELFLQWETPNNNLRLEYILHFYGSKVTWNVTVSNTFYYSLDCFERGVQKVCLQAKQEYYERLYSDLVCRNLPAVNLRKRKSKNLRSYIWVTACCIVPIMLVILLLRFWHSFVRLVWPDIPDPSRAFLTLKPSAKVDMKLGTDKSKKVNPLDAYSHIEVLSNDSKFCKEMQGGLEDKGLSVGSLLIPRTDIRANETIALRMD